MEYSEINQLFQILFETQDDAEREEANNRILDFKQRGESVSWVLSTYSTMDNIRIKQQQLLFMKHWFRKN